MKEVKVDMILQTLREELVPILITGAIFTPLAYLFLIQAPVPDALMGTAGIIIGYYFSRSATSQGANVNRTATMDAAKTNGDAGH